MTKSTVLVIDGGGRGSALAAKYLESRFVGKVLAIPGNDLMLTNKNVEIFPSVKTTESGKILNICMENKVDLVDVAQDDAVAAGVADVLVKNFFKVFGPTKSAGQIEWDKSWSKKFMEKNKIPTAKFKVFKTQSSGVSFIKKQKDSKWFVKASGLAAGKGAIFAANSKEAINAINQMKNFGKAGETFIIEEYLEGEEFSSFAAVNGKSFIILGHAQDHKTVYDGNLGPNTGGMGCSSQPLAITPQIEKQVNEIFKKTVVGLAKLKRPYLGILYLGGIIDSKDKVDVIEFNARWGDPEAQVIIPSIKNDFFEMATQIIEGKINKIKIRKDNLYRVVITAASKGYPVDYKNAVGKNINGLGKVLKMKNLKVYGAGVKKLKNKYIVAGGRLFYIMAAGPNVAQARKIAYNALSRINIGRGLLHFRNDIGYRDLNR
jgi:phosphoribosylamine--glycine ligase